MKNNNNVSKYCKNCINPGIIINFSNMAVSNVNIIDYSCYNAEDSNAVAEAKNMLKTKLLFQLKQHMEL